MSVVVFFFPFFFLRFYLFVVGESERERARARAHTQAGRGAEGGGEAGFPLSREPDSGLDPRIPGSCPEPKADRLSHPDIPSVVVFIGR